MMMIPITTITNLLSDTDVSQGANGLTYIFKKSSQWTKALGMIITTILRRREQVLTELK